MMTLGTIEFCFVIASDLTNNFPMALGTVFRYGMTRMYEETHNVTLEKQAVHPRAVDNLDWP